MANVVLLELVILGVSLSSEYAPIAQGVGRLTPRWSGIRHTE